MTHLETSLRDGSSNITSSSAFSMIERRPRAPVARHAPAVLARERRADGAAEGRARADGDRGGPVDGAGQAEHQRVEHLGFVASAH